MFNRIGFIVLVGHVSGAFLGEKDICQRSIADHTWNIEVGDQGQIGANFSQKSSSFSGHCSIKLTTCSACHFELDFFYLMPPPHDMETHCRDDFVRFKEVDDASRREFCGQFTKNNTYEFISEANEVSIDFFYSKTEGVEIIIYFEAIQNMYFITELSEKNNPGYVQSPFFPNFYPRQYSTEYFFSNSMPFGRVLLVFTDFDIALNSQLELIDTNGSSIGVYSSETFRPPAVLSSGFALGIKFSANGNTNSGFKAQFFFRHASAPNYLAPAVPITKCGGLVSDFGGTITMQNTINSNLTKSYDCVWILKPPSYSYSLLHISVNLIDFSNLDTGSKLWIRKGIHSTSPLLQLVTPQNFNNLPERMWATSLEDAGLYLRLQGQFDSNSTLTMTYTAFDYWTCAGDLGTLCNNHHCIQRSLFCDGFDHCGDGSDELPAICYMTVAQNHFWWHSRPPNFIIPPDLSSRTLDMPLLACCVALVIMISTIGLALCLVIKKKSKRRRNELSRPSNSTDDCFVLEPITRDSPPRYEPPPSYDDISKTLFLNLQLQAEAVTSTSTENNIRSQQQDETRTD